MAQKYGLNSSVEWSDRGYTPVRGKCPKDPPCFYCYMLDYFKRFNPNPELRLVKKELHWSPRTPSKIAVCLNLDLFHPAIPRFWIQQVLNHVRDHPEHTWLFLSKNPERYYRFLFPRNTWLGTTVDMLPATQRNAEILAGKDRLRFVSFEPLLADPEDWIRRSLPLTWHRTDWIIIGGDSRKGAEKPPDEWADQLIQAARENDIAIWVKRNYGYHTVIKEHPHED